MKRVLAVLLAGIMLAGCSKKGTSAPPPGEAAITEKGMAYGPVAEKIIGPQGGVIESDDKRLSVNIPAGALTSNTSFRLQAIGNTNPAGVGLNYRLSPAITFAKPATITLNYGGEDSLDIDPCMLSLGYQDSSGAWKMKLNRVVNAINKTMSTAASSGGDWCMMTPIRLLPVESFIKKNEQVKLQVLHYIAMGEDGFCGMWNKSDDHHAEQAVLFGTPVMEELIEKWELLATGYGVGTLTPKGAVAIYKASNVDNPVMNPASIAVTLKGASRNMLARVYVEPEETYMIITLGSKTYIYVAVEASSEENGSRNHVISWEERPSRIERGYITWQGSATGNHIWDMSSNQFHFAPEDFPNDGYLISFEGEEAEKASDGYVKIDQFGAIGQFVTGTFVVTNAARWDPDAGFQGASKVTGRFKARRVP